MNITSIEDGYFKSVTEEGSRKGLIPSKGIKGGAISLNLPELRSIYVTG
jgi:hypothetical protein